MVDVAPVRLWSLASTAFDVNGDSQLVQPDAHPQPWYVKPWARDLQLWMYMGIPALSLASCCYVLWSCLDRSRRRKLIFQQLIMQASTEILFLVWTYVPASAQKGTLLYAGDPPWCSPYHAIARSLQLLSAMLASAVAFGLLAAIMKSKLVLAGLRHAHFLLTPLAFLMNLHFFSAKERRWHHRTPFPYCQVRRVSEVVFTMELSVLLVAVIVVHAYVYWRMKQAVPRSVLDRSVRNGSKYIMAFFASYGVYIISQVYVVFYGRNPENGVFWAWHISRDAMYNMHGFFNYLAFLSHRKLDSERPQANQFDLPVTFGANEEIEFDTGSLVSSASSGSIINLPQEETDDSEAWDMLGLGGQSAGRTPTVQAPRSETLAAMEQQQGPPPDDEEARGRGEARTAFIEVSAFWRRTPRASPSSASAGGSPTRSPSSRSRLS
eukprot:TRINITY_DN74179_c0_g1_i1.p1 TRINITY_DN74179_c0_g1~~TRINITY_DN74179_c0_g1_i1.p1  ORF type:complete len:436 (-),score=60.55 TRINITY_DN74179_c0_g1_i1:800-2107(-)